MFWLFNVDGLVLDVFAQIEILLDGIQIEFL
jgi:hypothetical protein